MTTDDYQIRQLLDELSTPDSGKQSLVVSDDAHAKVVLFAFAAGAGLIRHAAPLPAIIQIIQGHAELMVGEESVTGRPGTWIRMAAHRSRLTTEDTEEHRDQKLKAANQ